MSETKDIMLTVPRGSPNQPPLRLDMNYIYKMEQRLSETKIVTPATAIELRASFNEACNMTTKYLAWIRFEILMAKKYLELARADVIIDKLPTMIEQLEEKGIKNSADIREALVVKDKEYQDKQNIVYALEAMKELLESKSKTFERAYWDCRSTAEDKNRLAASPNFSGSVGMLDEPQVNFMGQNQLPNR